MRAMNERLAKELDATRTTLNDLAANHAAALAQNQALADQAKIHAVALAAAETARAKLEADFHAQLEAKQATLIDTQNQLVAATKASADESKARQAQLAKLSIGAGVLAALCLAGAIWSPVFKSELGIAAAVLAGAAVTIPFVTGLWVLIGVGVAVAALVAWAAVKYHKEERVSDALSLTVQDLRDKGGSIAAAVEHSIKDRLASYRRAKDGTLVAESNPALEAHIDAKIAAYDHLPTTTVTPATTP